LGHVAATRGFRLSSVMKIDVKCWRLAPAMDREKGFSFTFELITSNVGPSSQGDEHFI
jgi:hypothetical protein